MFDAIVGEFMKSGTGAELLGQLAKQGVAAPQAQAAVTATAEGAMNQLGGAGGVAEFVQKSLGGAGGLGGLVGGLLGGGAPASAGVPAALSSLVGPVAQFVAQKTGLSADIATMVVNAALPKLMSMLQGSLPAGAAAVLGGEGGLGATLGGLFK